MAIEKEHIYESGIYFLTFTNYKWLPLFAVTDGYDIVYKWFDFLKTQGHSVAGYVIMPNHVHALIGFHPTDKSINTIVGNGKRFMAYDIVERLKTAGNVQLLDTLAAGVDSTDRKRGKLHEVFEPSFDLKLCFSYKFLKQKLDYMHANPVSKKWNLVKDAVDYKHSSAMYYHTGEQGCYDVLHTNEWVYDNWNHEILNKNEAK